MHARAPVQPVTNEFMLPPMRMHGNTTARTKPDGIRGQMLDLLFRGLGPEAVPVIEVHVRPTDPMRERITQYLSRYNELKQGPPVLLKQTGAHLAYAFRGDTVSRPVSGRDRGPELRRCRLRRRRLWPSGNDRRAHSGARTPAHASPNRWPHPNIHPLNKNVLALSLHCTLYLY